MVVEEAVTDNVALRDQRLTRTSAHLDVVRPEAGTKRR